MQEKFGQKACRRPELHAKSKFAISNRDHSYLGKFPLYIFTNKSSENHLKTLNKINH